MVYGRFERGLRLTVIGASFHQHAYLLTDRHAKPRPNPVAAGRVCAQEVRARQVQRAHEAETDAFLCLIRGHMATARPESTFVTGAMLRRVVAIVEQRLSPVKYRTKFDKPTH